MSRYIIIVGGVISGLGKGITAASIARLLTDRGYRVTNIKIDAYVNIDAGTMNPTEHGEVFVTDDGIETDQDVGNYERFLDRDLSRHNYTTTGQIYRSVINKERNLEYGGKCVEVVPHIPLEIIDRIKKAAKKDNAEITIIEIGGTIGEYQNILFIEAARLMKYRNPGKVLTILVSYVPIPKSLGEMKTKPTQYASRTLNETGIQADFIICRGEKSLDQPRKERIALLCNMQSHDDILSAPDVDNIYRVPLILKRQKLDVRILEKLGLKPGEKIVENWKFLIKKIDDLKDEVNIAVLGKYFATGEFLLADVYVSVIAAIRHGCWANNVKPVLTWVDAEDVGKTPGTLKELSKFDGVVVPGGFGFRGVEEIISSIQYIRENKIPFLGLCYGMQLAAVEFARNKCNIADANTTEIDPDAPEPVIHLMPDQLKKLMGEGYGGTMRLGKYPAKLTGDSIVREIYGEETVGERHRHRYEFNNKYRGRMEREGLVFSGTSPDGNLVEIIELPREIHPFFVAVQFHPEFRSRPLSPHPLFVEFVRMCKK